MTADVQVEIAVIVDIHETWAGAPGIVLQFQLHSGPFGHVLEPEVAQIAIKSVAAKRAREEEVGATVPIVVADRHTAAGACRVDAVDRHAFPWRPVDREVHAGTGWSKQQKMRRAHLATVLQWRGRNKRLIRS